MLPLLTILAYLAEMSIIVQVKSQNYVYTHVNISRYESVLCVSVHSYICMIKQMKTEKRIGHWAVIGQ